MNERYHFIGIGGIGMSGLAHLLLERGVAVSGSDVAFNSVIEGLMRRGATIYKGQSAGNIPPGAKVVYSTDIKSDNPELLAAREGKGRLFHRSDLLNELLEGRRALAVTGTHGKTTTSSLLASVLVEAEKDPSFAIGGIVRAFQSNARAGQGEHFVFEADESDCSFLKYRPFGAIVTNVDHDHLSHYAGSFDLLVESFGTFMGQVQSPDHLFWCGDDPSLSELNLPGLRYGFHPANDWQITAVRQEGFRTYFDLAHGQCLYREIELALMGRHQVLNATAVFGLAMSLGVEEKRIRQGFREFQGVLRRCELKGSCHGVSFLDDYAHHPVEIEATLQGIRQAIGPRRLIAVFQPHRYSRTQDCLGKYGRIFDQADVVLLTDIYGAGETPIPHLSHEVIHEEIRQQSTIPCHYVPCTAISHYLSQFVRPYDVVVTLGAGDVTKFGGESLALLEKRPPSSLKVGWIWDRQTFAQFRERWQRLSFPDLTFYEWGMESDGVWVEGKDLTLWTNEKPPQDCAERLPPAIVQSLSHCDVVVSLLSPDALESAVQGFIGVLGKPYIGSHLRSLWLRGEGSAAACVQARDVEHLILSALRGVTPPLMSLG